ncbi:MAG TPA: tetratricopeptide repeat protein, partial [Nitrosopumilaceae archaeon]|nr:tetratricopeptide repeat protein [Nitrosopumilaceae archaeon]
FDKELKNDPNNVEILTNKGAALAKLGHFEEAILYYDNALDINPSFVPALNNKANALSKLGEFDKAIVVYNIAKNLEPNNKILDKNLAISKTKFSSLEKNKEQTPEPPIQISKNEKIERIAEIKSEKKSSAPDLLEQIGIVFSSLGSIFGFH